MRHKMPWIIEIMGKSQEKTPATIVKVESADDQRRLDNFLMSRLRGVPRSRVYRMIRGGEVRVTRIRCDVVR